MTLHLLKRSLLPVIAVATILGCATRAPETPAVAPPVAARGAEAASIETARKSALFKSLRFNESNGKWELLLPEPLLFAFDQYVLTEAARQRLSTMGATLAEAKAREVIIVGHTDNVGSREHNERLSQRRAQSVAAALMLGGLDERTIVVMGVANDVPIASNRTAEGRAENRRVAIIVEP
jgi:outer membrane protein OmpA-like peptidoglycan-associated protein